MSKRGSFAVSPFSFVRLVDLCCQDGETQAFRDRGFVERKPQIRYVADYLRALGCATILREDGYVDGDFLDDYAAYYVRCYRGYRRKCVRLHFFRTKITEPDLLALLRGDASIRRSIERDKGAYLGFIVLRPLPETFIGKCCLRHFDDGGGRRQYPMAREYVAHFAGLRFSVPSLAFQEQDTVLSACATSALWTALQRTAGLFGHPLPTPTQITRAATLTDKVDGRVIPTQGLEIGQICRAIHSLGLEVESRTHQELKGGALRELVYAYGAYGLPLLLGIRPLSGSRRTLHAVTVTGFSLPKSERNRRGRRPAPLTADRIDKLYIHDDQRGPFLRAPFIAAYDTALLLGDGNELAAACDVFALIAPVYPKVRIRYESAREVARQLDALLGSIPGLEYEWDIRLAEGATVSEDYLARKRVPAQVRHSVLRDPFPRFVWRVRARTYTDRTILEAILDATDIERSFILYKMIAPDERTAAVLSATLGRTKHRMAVAAAFPFRSEKWMNALVEATATPTLEELEAH